MQSRFYTVLSASLLAISIAVSTTVVLANQSTTSSSQVAKASPYIPPPIEMCQMLQMDAAKATKANFTLSKALFTDYVTGQKGRGCLMVAKGTGAQFGNPATVINALKTAFIGWDENVRYQADGPTGKATAFMRDSALLLASVEWNPAPSAKCPADRPISDCRLSPQQMLYTIKLQVAMH